MIFISPSKGRLTLDEVFDEIRAYIDQYPDDSFRLIIGTDSQLRVHAETTYVTALIIHRKGKGARFFYTRSSEVHTRSLRQRIFYEASQSLSVASQVLAKMADLVQDIDVEIHLDVGNNGATKELIKEVVGMVNGSGFTCRIKPQAYGASSVADRFTK
ncbi:MAG: hypothetical protein GX205_06120 [Firmicutes bacterium]|jgi:predicted RNase H-related nuclease YkuK (DUF458 family)|nr:hypothetical protein [Bacillota bacterium]